MRERLKMLRAGTKFVEDLGLRAFMVEHNTHPALVKHLRSASFPEQMGEICCPHSGEDPLLRALFGMTKDQLLVVFLLVGDKTENGRENIDAWYDENVKVAESLFQKELEKLRSAPNE